MLNIKTHKAHPHPTPQTQMQSQSQSHTNLAPATDGPLEDSRQIHCNSLPVFHRHRHRTRTRNRPRRPRRPCLLVPSSSSPASSSATSFSSSSTTPSPTFPCFSSALRPALTRVRRSRRSRRDRDSTAVVTTAPPRKKKKHGFGVGTGAAGTQSMPEVSEGQRRYILAIPAPPNQSACPSTGLGGSGSCTSSCSSGSLSEDVDVIANASSTTMITPSLSTAVQFEAARLDRQHEYYKHASEGYLLHPLLYPLINTPAHRQFNRIMDVGCGTGIWMMDYLSQSSNKSTVTMHGCDINLSAIKSHLRSYCIEHDVLRPFPIGSNIDVGRQGSYDLVHCRLLIYALEKGIGWKMAIQNMVRLLKPNGILHLSELNAVAHLPPNSNLINESTNPIHRINTIATLTLSYLNKDQYAGTNLQSHLKGAGLETSSVKKICIPFGKLARDLGYHPMLVEHGIRCALKAIQVLKVPYLAAGGLSFQDGGVGRTTWAFDSWLIDVEKAIRDKGMVYEFFMCYGRRVEE